MARDNATPSPSTRVEPPVIPALQQTYSWGLGFRNSILSKGYILPKPTRNFANWNFRMYELLLKEFVDCLLWSPSQSLRIACIKQTLLVLYSSTTFRNFDVIVFVVYTYSQKTEQGFDTVLQAHIHKLERYLKTQLFCYIETHSCYCSILAGQFLFYRREPSISTMSGSQYGISVCTCTLFSRGFTTSMELSSLFHPSLGIVRCIIDLWTIKIC